MNRNQGNSQMLTPSEREKLEQELLVENKRVMKEILILAELCLPSEKFENFRHSTFNHFGLSGLQSKTRKILDEYTDKEGR